MPSTSLNKYRVKQLAVVLALVTYVLVASLPRGEVFPFFNWDLFSDVPQADRADYGLLVTAIDGEELVEPIFLEETEGMAHLARSPNAHRIVQSLGSALERGHEVEAKDASAAVAAILFPDRHVAYDIVFRRYNIVDRAREREFVEIRRIGQFEAGPAQ